MTTDSTRHTSGSAHPKRTAYHHRNRRVIIPDGLMAVGVIVGAHGLRGEIKVELHTDVTDRFAAGTTLLLGLDLNEVVIRTSRLHKGFQLITLSEINSRTAVEDLRGEWFFISEDDAAQLGDDTFWIHDIIGMGVVDTDARLLGNVHNILQTGANDVYLVTPAEGVNQDREILIPATNEVVQNVDPDTRTITISLLPGLLDEE